MSRTQKDTVSYFPHDANASAGDTLAVLQGQFGNDGYAFWFKLLERLASAEGHFIDCSNPRKWQLLLARAGVDKEAGGKMMEVLIEMGAIDEPLWTCNRVIWCQNLVDNVADAYRNRRREIPQKPSTTAKKAITTGKKAITTARNTQSKVKDSNTTCIVIFDEWNRANIIVHEKLTSEIETAITRVLHDHPGAEVMAAINNYATILHDNGYFFKYKWTLRDFLRRGIEKFLDLEIAKSNFRSNDRGKNKHSRELPTTYTPSRPEADDD